MLLNAFKMPKKYIKKGKGWDYMIYMSNLSVYLFNNLIFKDSYIIILLFFPYTVYLLSFTLLMCGRFFFIICRHIGNKKIYYKFIKYVDINNNSMIQ
jgi:hypothetical protein